MYFLDFLSQYSRFVNGKMSAPDWAYWLNSHSDEMEDVLNDEEWKIFVSAQHAASEYSGGYIDEARFRHVLESRIPKVSKPLATTQRIAVKLFGMSTDLEVVNLAVYPHLRLTLQSFSRTLPHPVSIQTTSNAVTKEAEPVLV